LLSVRQLVVDALDPDRPRPADLVVGAIGGGPSSRKKAARSLVSVPGSIDADLGMMLDIGLVEADRIDGDRPIAAEVGVEAMGGSLLRKSTSAWTDCSPSRPTDADRGMPTDWMARIDGDRFIGRLGTFSSFSSIGDSRKNEAKARVSSAVGSRVGERGAKRGD
jgi:hypothetical protein